MASLQKPALVASLTLNAVMLAVAVYFVPKALDGYSDLESILRAFVDRRVGSFNATRVAKADVAFIGDSITHEGLWGEYFPELVVVNRGISGAKTRDLFDLLPDIAQHQPDKVFVLVGINDLNAKLSVAEITQDYNTFYDKVEALFPQAQVYVQSVMPVNDDWVFDVQDSDITALNQVLQAQAQTRGFTFVDLVPALSAEDGTLNPLLSNDGIHLTHAGYQAWLKIIDPLVLGEGS